MCLHVCCFLVDVCVCVCVCVCMCVCVFAFLAFFGQTISKFGGFRRELDVGYIARNKMEGAMYQKLAYSFNCPTTQKAGALRCARSARTASLGDVRSQPRALRAWRTPFFVAVLPRKNSKDTL